MADRNRRLGVSMALQAHIQPETSADEFLDAVVRLVTLAKMNWPSHPLYVKTFDDDEHGFWIELSAFESYETERVADAALTPTEQE